METSHGVARAVQRLRRGCILRPMRHATTAILALAALSISLPAPARAQDQKERTRCEETLDLFRKTDPELGKYFDGAVGYAVFPSIGKGAFIVGGAGGSGCLYEDGAIIGKAKMVQVTIGLQLGGQSYAELIFFQNADALESFKGNSLELSAQVSAVAAASGAAANAKYRLGVLVFTIAKTGLMYEASVGGQKFSFTPAAADTATAGKDGDTQE